MKGKPETIVEGYAVNRDTPSGRLVHCRVRLRDHKVVPRGQEVLFLKARPSRWEQLWGLGRPPENSAPSATIPGIGTDGEWPFLLNTDFPGVGGPLWLEELVDAPSEDERLDNPSEVEEDIPSEEELVLVEATSAARFAMMISQGCETSTSGLRILGVEEYSQLDHEGVPSSKRGTAEPFWVPYIDFSEECPRPPGHNQGWEARELWMTALHLRADQPFRNKMKIQGGSLKMRMNTQAKPLKIRGRSLRRYRPTSGTRDSARNTPFRNLVHDHGVEDRLHRLRDIGVLSIPCSHAKVKTRAKDKVIFREGPRTLSRGLPQRPSKGFSNVFGRHLSASEVRKANHFPFLSLSSLKDWSWVGCDMTKKTRRPFL
ncbi:LOW QUALITY PROTEIN: hypothetical protein Cgig2_005757 [Carnegiea gigantea]|uniref:Uncharacterized protein n=1 Tax=Carnegiea gigantea TaxID=171969 RepID=A0A9Q1GNT5_9CARY|nr:LOW QUALITY PROTEIN: hypothetical protein Cgig2_005757 [Carnegiea gigantea]